eukprot:CAMPEP_0113683320 /NCGR_PEP_ID=MMETSP0038_2-20120614/13226_1 /TAXON_ID=2898 /ORGANISM="Cryptomonas paramecium" /LENGTH=53 /DNA_ID=CAMNT_0000602633 /DNA_START=42 /DNA_END=199 /DNA_ORIENTATION=+ /assembly_acc=CAM_ASM_000170
MAALSGKRKPQAKRAARPPNEQGRKTIFGISDHAARTMPPIRHASPVVESRRT